MLATTDLHIKMAVNFMLENKFVEPKIFKQS